MIINKIMIPRSHQQFLQHMHQWPADGMLLKFKAVARAFENHYAIALLHQHLGPMLHKWGWTRDRFTTLCRALHQIPTSDLPTHVRMGLLRWVYNIDIDYYRLLAKHGRKRAITCCQCGRGDPLLYPWGMQRSVFCPARIPREAWTVSTRDIEQWLLPLR